jgi:hypothetical protein
VYGFFIVNGIQMALLQQWTGVEVDMAIHEVTYAHQKGGFHLIPTHCIRTLVGTMEERDQGTGLRGPTKMIVGAMAELRRGWPNSMSMGTDSTP